MKVEKISFENYRNLKKDCFEAHPDVNIIYGDNAQGKTNLIEAIWLFTGIKSFSGAKDNELINIDKQNLKLDLDFYGNGRKQTATIKIGEKKEILLNGVKKTGISSLVGEFTAVVFSPDNLFLIKKGPEERRKFLNSAISQLWPKYMPSLYAYMRGVQQRNVLLKDARYHSDLINMMYAYEEEMAQKAYLITKYRIKYCQMLSECAKEIYEGISGGKEKLSINYLYKADSEEKYIELFEQNRENDIISGVTTVGPHRDDLEILIDGKSAKAYGSQGQQRSAVISIKLAEAEIINKITGEQPVILLDDVMSELDEQRQDYILNHIKGRQVFITCCDKITAEKLETGGLFKMRSGEIEK